MIMTAGIGFMRHRNKFTRFIRQQAGINRIGNDPPRLTAFLADDGFDTGHFHILQQPLRCIRQGAEQANLFDAHFILQKGLHRL